MISVTNELFGKERRRGGWRAGTISGLALGGVLLAASILRKVTEIGHRLIESSL